MCCKVVKSEERKKNKTENLVDDLKEKGNKFQVLR